MLQSGISVSSAHQIVPRRFTKIYETSIYTVRTVVVILCELLVGFCFNGEEYGGDFDFSLSFPQLMIIMTVLAVTARQCRQFPSRGSSSRKRRRSAPISASTYLLCKRVEYQVIAYHFFSGIFSSISYTASSPMQSYMVDVTPINDTLNNILSHVCFMIGIMVASKYGLVTTVGNLASPFASTLTLLIDDQFNITNTRVQIDDQLEIMENVI